METDTATVTITVTAVNDAPVAVNDNFSVNEDMVLMVPAPGVLGNDTDVDMNALTAVLVTGVSNGMLTLNSDGSFTYTPNSNFNGTDSFTYRANDGSLDSNVATVTITVNAVNDAPVANAGPDQTVNEGATVTLDGRGSSDADGDRLTFSWRQTAGPAVTLMGANTAQPTFVAPLLQITDPLRVVLTFELIVNDGSVNSPPDTVNVTVENLLILRDDASRNQLVINLASEQQTVPYEFIVGGTGERFTGTARILRGQGDGNQWHIFDVNNPTRLSANVDVRRRVATGVFVDGTRVFSFFDANIENNVP
jgi:VCBS repeat-containing protein